jgi:hypothetical protein
MLDTQTGESPPSLRQRKKISSNFTPPDFVSHIASTYDKPWMKILFDFKLLKHAHPTKQNLKYISPLATHTFHTAKMIRKALKEAK